MAARVLYQADVKFWAHRADQMRNAVRTYASMAFVAITRARARAQRVRRARKVKGRAGHVAPLFRAPILTMNAPMVIVAVMALATTSTAVFAAVRPNAC